MPHVKPNRQYLARLCKRYAMAHRKVQSAILDEFVATTGYHRKHAITLLSGQRQWRDPAQAICRPRRRLYTAEDQRSVFWLIALFDDIGSKRLLAAMDIPIRTFCRLG